MVGGQGGSQRLHLHDPAQQAPPGKAFLPPKELHLIVCESLTEISTGTETNGICFSLPRHAPLVPREPGVAERAGLASRGGHAFLRQRCSGRKLTADLAGCELLQGLSLAKKRETEGTAQLRTWKERKLGAERRVQAAGGPSLYREPAGRAVCPMEVPQAGPRSPSGVGAARFPLRPYSQCCPSTPPRTGYHRPADPCSVPCPHCLSPAGPPWNWLQLRRPSRPPSLSPEPHASTHRALTGVGGRALSSCVGDAGFRGHRAGELTQPPRPRGPRACGGVSG